MYEDLRAHLRAQYSMSNTQPGEYELKRLAQRRETVWRVEKIITPGPYGTRDGGCLIGAKARYGDGTLTADEAEAQAAAIHSSERVVKTRAALANHW